MATSGGREANGAPAQSPSNRKGLCPLGVHPPLIGLDRLSLSFRCADFNRSDSQWDGYSRKRRPEGFCETFSKSERVGGVNVFVSVQEVPEAKAGRWWGKVEANPSRVVDPDGVGLAGVDQLPAVLDVMALAAGIEMSPAEPVEDWRVKRLDLARDFEDVEDPGRMIRGLGPVHRPYARLNMIHADPQRNRAETLMVGSGAGVVRLYNKHTESKGRAAEGTVRWEVEARKDWCQKNGDIGRVRDLTDEKTRQLAVERWEWSQMGVEVASSVGRLVRATARSGLTERERVFFVGWLMCEAGGQPVRGLSRMTETKYRKLQRDLGIAAPMDLTSAVEVVSRLDWESGRELLRVA